MTGTFVCYRRDDSANAAGRLYDHLRNRFGKANVFRDLDALEPGVRWDEAIGQFIAGCDAVVVVIGRGWLDARDSEDRRRLDDESDPVRREVLAASEQGKLLIPVLVDDARMPSAEELPPALRFLSELQALPIDDSRWDFDTGRLISRLESIRPEARAMEQLQAWKKKVIWLLPVALVVGILAGAVLGRSIGPDDEPVPGRGTALKGTGVVTCSNGDVFSLEVLRPETLPSGELRVPIVVRNPGTEAGTILAGTVTATDHEGRQLEPYNEKWDPPYRLDPGAFYGGHLDFKTDATRPIKGMTVRFVANGACDPVAAHADF